MVQYLCRAVFAWQGVVRGMDAATVAGWEARFEQFTDAIGPCFKRQDLRRQAIGYLQGLLGRV